MDRDVIRLATDLLGAGITGWVQHEADLRGDEQDGRTIAEAAARRRSRIQLAVAQKARLHEIDVALDLLAANDVPVQLIEDLRALRRRVVEELRK